MPKPRTRRIQSNGFGVIVDGVEEFVLADTELAAKAPRLGPCRFGGDHLGTERDGAIEVAAIADQPGHAQPKLRPYRRRGPGPGSSGQRLRRGARRVPPHPPAPGARLPIAPVS